MAMLKIFPLEDTKEENGSVLSEGEHIIGRGFLNCHDKRISRKHAIIKVSDNIVTLQAVHVNPCFYKSGDHITIISKDASVILNDGDQFSFLADNFWFKVKFAKEGDEQNSNKTIPLQNNIQQGTPSIQNGNCTNFAEPSTSSTTLSDTSSTSKRSHEDNFEEILKRQKLNIDVSREAAVDTKTVKSCLSQKLDKLLNSSSNENQDLNKEEDIDTKKLLNNLYSIVKEDYGDDNDKSTLGEYRHPSVKQEEIDGGREVQGNSGIKTERQDNNHVKDEVEEVVNGDQEKVHENKRDHIDKIDNNEAGEDVEHTSSIQNDNQGKASGSSNDDKNPKPRRERCWYGPTCYRKNPIHRADFSHPGDNDYDSDPDDDRPPCPFGALCYRKNLLHRRQYKHLNPPASKPNNGGVKPKKKRTPKKQPSDNNTGSGESDDDNSDNKPRRKRKAAQKKTNYDSPEDDYDYEDPFVDDASSDEFELSDDDDHDDSTDWEDSQKVEESEETRRLLKEAKRFTKGKGKK